MKSDHTNDSLKACTMHDDEGSEGADYFAWNWLDHRMK